MKSPEFEEYFHGVNQSRSIVALNHWQKSGARRCGQIDFRLAACSPGTVARFASAFVGRRGKATLETRRTVSPSRGPLPAQRSASDRGFARELPIDTPRCGRRGCGRAAKDWSSARLEESMSGNVRAGLNR